VSRQSTTAPGTHRSASAKFTTSATKSHGDSGGAGNRPLQACTPYAPLHPTSTAATHRATPTTHPSRQPPPSLAHLRQPHTPRKNSVHLPANQATQQPISPGARTVQSSHSATYQHRDPPHPPGTPSSDYPSPATSSTPTSVPPPTPTATSPPPPNGPSPTPDTNTRRPTPIATPNPAVPTHAAHSTACRVQRSTIPPPGTNTPLRDLFNGDARAQVYESACPASLRLPTH